MITATMTQNMMSAKNSSIGRNSRAQPITTVHTKQLVNFDTP